MDMLVKLYALTDADELSKPLAQRDMRVRRAMAFEKDAVVSWVERQFGETAPGWKSECEMAFARTPIACSVALVQGDVAGFVCHDVIAPNFLGPIGVAAKYRSNGFGKLLLLEALVSMRNQGYAYAIVGHVGPERFFERAVGAIPIPDSTPGIYPTDWVR